MTLDHVIIHDSDEDKLDISTTGSYIDRMRILKKKHKRNQPWLDEHFNDPYVKKARMDGFRSRAVYKLQELNERDGLLRTGMTVVDLGAAPGSWSQWVAQSVGDTGRVLAVDILPVDPLDRVEFIQGDFQENEVLDKLLNLMRDQKANLVISDMAPNITGMNVIDQPKAMYLAELAADFARQALISGGDLVVKAFQGAGFDGFIHELDQSFDKVMIRKPRASRPRSREVYVVARNYQSYQNHIVT